MDTPTPTLLRVVTCGSVDDGKSTLLGHLLYEAGALLDDQIDALQRDSKVSGTRGGDLDFALLLDGLTAEREQGITIDVAHRYFRTPKRTYILADCPGHEQYTRNMVTGASTADVAVILVDASKGVLPQTRRHAYIVGLLGVPRAVVAINKMDLIDFDEARFGELRANMLAVAREAGIDDVTIIPVSAVGGDNLTTTSTATPWYAGPTLLGYLDDCPVAVDRATSPTRLPVQTVVRPDTTFRGVAGLLASGRIKPGTRLMVQPEGHPVTVDRIVGFSSDGEAAVAGQSVLITLREHIDIGRGHLLSSADSPAVVADQVEADIVWMGDAPMLPGRTYLARCGTQDVVATVTRLKYAVNVDSFEHAAASALPMNGIGRCALSFDRPLAFDPYADNHATGGLILIDRFTEATVGAGLIRFALRRSDNIAWQATTVDQTARSALLGHGSGVVWFTGLSGAGKSTIANALESQLAASGHHTYLLDGDNVRHGLNRDLGFTDADRVENIRRIGEVAALMADAGLIVLVAAISPFRSERDAARALVGPRQFCEVFVDTSLAVAESRDPKGLYAKARAGQLTNFTGIDSPYEAPISPEVVIDGGSASPEAAAARIVDALRRLGVTSLR